MMSGPAPSKSSASSMHSHRKNECATWLSGRSSLRERQRKRDSGENVNELREKPFRNRKIASASWPRMPHARRENKKNAPVATKFTSIGRSVLP